MPLASAIEGTGDRLALRLINTGNASYSGPLTITLYVSTDAAVSSDDVVATTVTIPHLSLRFGASKTLTIKFTYPAAPVGSYDLIASIDATGTAMPPAVVVAPAPVTLVEGSDDLATTFASGVPVLMPGERSTVLVTITNKGNVTANGTLTLKLFASGDATLDASDALLATVPIRRLRLKPGRSITVRVHFTAPADLTTGASDLIASTVSSLQLADQNPFNDVAVIGTAG